MRGGRRSVVWAGGREGETVGQRAKGRGQRARAKGKGQKAKAFFVALCPMPSALRDRSLVSAAAAAGLAILHVDRRAVGTKPRLGFDAPVPRAVVLVVELPLVGIGRRCDVHPFVAQAQAMNARREFRRCQVIHIVMLAVGSA